MSKPHNNLDIFDHATAGTRQLDGDSIKAMARIFAAIARRMSPEDLMALANLVDGENHAGAQLGLSSQLAAHNRTEQMAVAMIEKLGAHDREVLASIIQSTVTGDDQ